MEIQLVALMVAQLVEQTVDPMVALWGSPLVVPSVELMAVLLVELTVALLEGK